MTPSKKVEYEEISEEDMASALMTNFETYCRDYKAALEEQMEIPEEEFEGEKASDKKPDYELYQKLANTNGKKGDEVVASLLSVKLFDKGRNTISSSLKEVHKVTRIYHRKAAQEPNASQLQWRAKMACCHAQCCFSPSVVLQRPSHPVES